MRNLSIILQTWDLLWPNNAKKNKEIDCNIEVTNVKARNYGKFYIKGIFLFVENRIAIKFKAGFILQSQVEQIKHIQSSLL